MDSVTKLQPSTHVETDDPKVTPHPTQLDQPSTRTKL